ncbi:26765_t:CDS:2 [Dentiscutata erythropus]|uniref:26765_t:CDS:1 n=1 Tax=Dentiscutata erythropus TaxID=1348616 RepID=A0A9N9FC42_9GLOM|nr:26765_t:CDS:2 [Dentiscutata erythropus]
MEASINKLTVAKTTKYLRKTSISYTLTQALPLGLRLAHIDSTIPRDCPWCPNKQQKWNIL